MCTFTFDKTSVRFLKWLLQRSIFTLMVLLLRERRIRVLHSEAAMESTESRFAHLLQPIRELTKNWDIDVASELNDYLEEVNSSPV